MNQIQKDEITRLRGAGLGYAKIAQALGLPENTVKSFCRRNDLGGVRANPFQRKQTQQSFCLQCGKPMPIKEKKKPKIFCSDACRKKWWNGHRKGNHSLVCANCGEKFICYNIGRKYCCYDCYVNSRFGKEGGDNHDK